MPEPAEDEVLQEAVGFYQCQLDRHSEALDYLHSRGLHDPKLIRELGIGYAPGGMLRRHLIRWDIRPSSSWISGSSTGAAMTPSIAG